MPTVSFRNPPTSIQASDCSDPSKTIHFDLDLSGFIGGATLELWAGMAGEDCADVTERHGVAATCTQLLQGLPLQTSQGVDVPLHSLALCSDGDAGAELVNVNALYFAPGNTSTPAASAIDALSIAKGTTPNDDGGCAASGGILDPSMAFVLGAVALTAIVWKRRAKS